ncbi:site-specific integrase [Rhizobium sophorae]|uniref:Site-specific integrase n=1 Tax=Rhizobium sophorae TaxID=1535242 RepID=A0A7Y3WHS5_9HYPH|nr:site-specific integrase [Rhizobium sophorae]MBX4865302.1 site-specific integrase [Rhizobium bangladeshense]NNU40391.1 site-specific integrase [Rhizobium sophorae]
MPFLVPAATGVPFEAPTFWVMASRRPQGRQPNTLSNELRCLMYLYLWGDARGVDVVERIREGVFFSLTETLDIANYCGRSMVEAIRQVEERSLNVVSRRKSGKALAKAARSLEKRNRLSAVRSFIEFTSADVLSTLSRWPQRWQQYSAVRAHQLELIDGQFLKISKPNRDETSLPEGLDPAAVKRLREVIEPDHPDNPFMPKVRFRNYLIVRLLLDLGMRRGEMLGIKIADFVPASRGTITIHRRPNDRDDPRRNKPASKTAARVLELSGRLTEIVHEWIVGHRRHIPGARRNPYLIVSTRDGAPMSESNVNKIMETLRDRVEGLPKELAPHPLRHTWNDNFSDLMDENKVSAENEIKWRKRLMGWRNENSAASYVRRTVRRRSNEAFAELQDKFAIGTKEQA